MQHAYVMFQKTDRNAREGLVVFGFKSNPKALAWTTDKRAKQQSIPPLDTKLSVCRKMSHWTSAQLGRPSLSSPRKSTHTGPRRARRVRRYPISFRFWAFPFHWKLRKLLLSYVPKVPLNFLERRYLSRSFWPLKRTRGF